MKMISRSSEARNASTRASAPGAARSMPSGSVLLDGSRRRTGAKVALDEASAGDEDALRDDSSATSAPVPTEPSCDVPSSAYATGASMTLIRFQLPLARPGLPRAWLSARRTGARRGNCPGSGRASIVSTAVEILRDSGFDGIDVESKDYITIEDAVRGLREDEGQELAPRAPQEAMQESAPPS